jgi:hypothetical protein
MNATAPTRLNIIAAVGLAVGGTFGLLGTVVTQSNLRAAFWGLDSVGLIVATALLPLKYFRSGNDTVSAGFLIFTVGEAVPPSPRHRILSPLRTCEGF